jgi:hypothetical protein
LTASWGTKMDERRDHWAQFVEVSGAAAVGVVGYTCPVGYTAKIIYFSAYHNEGANLNMEFVLSNGVLARNITLAVSVPTATLQQMYPLLVLPEPIILHQLWVLSASAPVTGAHILTYRAVLELRRGEAT